MSIINKISLTACLLVQAAAFAQSPPPAAQSDQGVVSDQDIQLLRKNLRSQRKQIIAANMKLSDTEAEKFWPVYEQYVSDLVKINTQKYALIKQYLQAQGAMSDADAETAVNQWLNVDKSVGDLRVQYIPNFRKVLSPKNTALFYQLDRRIQLMIDLQLASSIPLIEP